MKRFVQLLLAATLLAGIPAAAQFAVPEIPFDSAADPLKFPDNIHLGEAAGVATNSKGDVFVYTRTGHPTISIGAARPFAHGGSRLFQFDQDREIRSRDRTGVVRIPGRPAGARRSAGQHLGRRSDVEHGDQVRSERAGCNCCWAERPRRSASRRCRSRRSRLRPARAGSRRPRSRPAAAARRRGRRRRRRCAEDLPAPAVRATCFNGRPTWHGTRPETSTWPTATATPAWRSSTRTASSSSPGVHEGLAPGQFNTVHGIAIDAQGNVYVADSRKSKNSGLRRRRNVQDAVPQCRGLPRRFASRPDRVNILYSSNSNPPERYRHRRRDLQDGLNGKIVGRFGRAGKLPKEFGTVNAIDCRSENELYVAEIGNWRVQKLTLHPK